jgi:hypothetical protein
MESKFLAVRKSEGGEVHVSFTEENLKIFYPENVYSRAMIPCASMAMDVHPGFLTHEEVAIQAVLRRKLEAEWSAEAAWANSWRGKITNGFGRIQEGVRIGLSIVTGRAYVNEYGEYIKERKDSED